MTKTKAKTLAAIIGLAMMAGAGRADDVAGSLDELTGTATVMTCGPDQIAVYDKMPDTMICKPITPVIAGFAVSRFDPKLSSRLIAAAMIRSVIVASGDADVKQSLEWAAQKIEDCARINDDPGPTIEIACPSLPKITIKSGTGTWPE